MKCECICILPLLAILALLGILMALAVLLTSEEDCKRASQVASNFFVKLARLVSWAFVKLARLLAYAIAQLQLPRLATDVIGLEQAQAFSIGTILTSIAYFAYRGWL